MVVDTSAVLAILFGEIEGPLFARAIAADHRRLVSAVSALECAIIVEATKGEAGGRELDLLFHAMGATVVAFDEQQFEAARQAWRSFGKGRHPASLNIGDCCSYALSRSSGEPLLFKGEDFVKTDIGRAEYS